MAEFVPNTAELERALEMALLWATEFMQDKILEITPRDLDRLPGDIDRKDWKAPTRSTHFKPVNIGGHWYAGVSGKLKQSIAHDQPDKLEYRIGVTTGIASDYAKFLEFGTRTMRPRSFLRKGIVDNQQGALDTFKKLFSSQIW